MSEHARIYCKPRTIERYAGILRLHILPRLGTTKVEDVTRADVEGLHRAVGKVGKGSANRTVQLLSVMLTKAEDWGLRPEGRNACRGIKRFPERSVERFLSPEERARLDDVITQAMEKTAGEPGHVSHDCLVLFRLLSATGARKSEIIDLTWSMVDLDRKCLRLPDSKTGQKVIPLSTPAADILAGLKRRGQLVVSTAKGKPLNSRNVHRSWDTIRSRAGLGDVRLHDLRHSAASDALMAGVPLAAVGALLGHKSTRTTQRYAHISDDVLRQAVETMGRAIDENTRAGASVIPLRRSS